MTSLQLIVATVLLGIIAALQFIKTGIFLNFALDAPTALQQVTFTVLACVFFGLGLWLISILRKAWTMRMLALSN